MPDQLRKMIDKVVELWKKFTKKQKILIVSITAAVFVALGILAFAVSRPSYLKLYTAESTTEAAKVQELLTSEGISYEQSLDGLTFTVNSKDYTNATILLGSNDVPIAPYDISDAVDGSFSLTTSDKQKKWVAYLENKLASDLSQMEIVESAKVQINMPNDDGTILSSKKETTIAVSLNLNEDMDEEQAAGIAKYIKAAVGKETTEGITILDQKTSYVLFSGDDENSATGGLSSTQLSMKQKLTENMRAEVLSALETTKLFTDVGVALNLDVDFDSTSETSHEYSTMDGSNKGPITSESIYSATTQGGYAAAPGTDSNNDTTVVIDEEEGTYSTIDEEQRNYATNEKITQTESGGGKINYDQSSITVVANRYVYYYEDALREAGELDDTTWEAFQNENRNPVEEEEVNPNYLELVSRATGIPTERISFQCVDVPLFVDAENDSAFEMTDILQILLAVLIFALLGYVVFRSTRAQKEIEPEAELSVESLLESTTANLDTGEEEEMSLEDIGYAEKSETRILIEKFVEENPDAAALLLRNWLNEEWE